MLPYLLKLFLKKTRALGLYLLKIFCTLQYVHWVWMGAGCGKEATGYLVIRGINSLDRILCPALATAQV